MQIGKLLRTAKDPMKAILKETGGFKLFEGIVDSVERKTEVGFTFINIKLQGMHQYAESTFEFKAKNEVLVAYKNGRLAAIAPDIIIPVHPEKGKCITAEKIERGEKIAILGLPAPEKWKTSKGLKLWKAVLQRSNINEKYVPIEKLVSTMHP